MKAVSRAASFAFALTTLYLLDLTGPLISPTHDLVFHFPGPPFLLFVPVILDIILLWLLLTVLLVIASRNLRVQLVVWAALLLPVPSLLLATAALFSTKQMSLWLTRGVAAIALLTFVVVCLRLRTLLRAFQRAKTLIDTVSAFIALSGVLIVAELFWFGYQARGENAPPMLHHPAATVVDHPQPHRVVWILLDELSYEQVYENRFAGLDLSAFDRLAAQSTLLTHVIPADEYTRVAVPSLLSGHDLEDTGQSSNGRFITMKDDETERWSRLDPADTIFADAVAAGYTTGVAGWYEPYCRIFPSVLDRCFWSYNDAVPAESGLVAEVARPLRDVYDHTVASLSSAQPERDTAEGRADVRSHTADYRALLTASDALLTDASISFVYLHMPLPHPWGIYDRRTHTFPDHRTSYIDNLALADLYLGHVRQLLEQQKQWDSSTILVMGDHSWRSSFIWSKSPFWTPEEELASRHGDYDDRPAYLVKLPDQQTTRTVDTPFGAARTRSLLQELLNNRLESPAALAGWVSSQRQP